MIAHRGAFAEHPPGNTVAAFVAARQAGADWVELDVRPASDGALVVHHDAHLPDGRLVAATASTELPEWVPTLGEALDACAPMGVNVEIKVDDPVAGTAAEDRLVADVVALLAGRPARESFLVTSFTWSVLDRVRALDAGRATGLLALHPGDDPDVVAVAVAGGHDAVNPWAPVVTAELVERARAAGLAVYPWTVDDPDRLGELVALGVDGVITNVPDVARRVVDAAR